MPNLKQKVAKGAVWTLCEKLSCQAVGFVVSMVLARLLTPTDYGTVALTAIFFAVANVLVDGGFGNALIQKKDADDLDFNSVFYLNLSLSAVAYVGLFLAAPWIADFYHLPILKSLLRVIGLTLIINALFTIQVTRLTSMVNFKLQAKVSVANCVITGCTGIALAYFGYGVWALVGQQLMSCVFSTVAYWSLSGWHPQLLFSGKSFKELFGFGSKILLASCLHTVYTNISPLIVGRKYTAADLGFYSRGDSLASLPGGIFQSTLGRVLFPVLASIQDDQQRLVAAYNKYLRLMTSIVAPAMLLLAACSEPLIRLLIGEKWLPCVPYLQLLAIGWLVDPIIVVNLNILYVKGRSDVVLRLEVIKKLIAIAIVVTAVQFGVIWLCVGRVVYGYIALVINLNACGPFIGMSFWRQMREVWAIYVGAAFAAVCAYLSVCFFGSVHVAGSGWLTNLVSLVVSGCVGVGCYVVWAYGFKFDIIPEVRMIVHKIRMRM